MASWSVLVFTLAAAEASLTAEQTAHKTRQRAQALALGVECEEMCKAVGSFPEGCACPGWNGQPASSNDMDTRGCYDKYCVPIAHTADPCPSDEFATCVAENSKVPALLQVDWMDKITTTQAVIAHYVRKAARMKADTVSFGVECEEMCKTLGQYPNGCQCPGWNGEPASSDGLDDRNCYAKYCEPIAHTPDPCPSDEFVTCVSEHTSFLQINWKDAKAKVLKAIQGMVNRFKSDGEMSKKLTLSRK
jgi:hypothetical protein